MPTGRCSVTSSFVVPPSAARVVTSSQWPVVPRRTPPLPHACSAMPCLSSVFTPLTRGGKAFIPLDRLALLEGYASLLPREHVVIELADCAEPDAEVLLACRQLK